MTMPSNPGHGFRFLKKEPVPEKVHGGTDEYFVGNEWKRTLSSHNGEQAPETCYRRLLCDEDHRWIPLSERLPDKFPCQVAVKDRAEMTPATPVWIASGYMDGHFNCGGGYFASGKFTHWKPLRLSDPPEPEVSAEDKEFHRHWMRNFYGPQSNPFDVANQTWHAALAWERKRKP